MHHGVTISLQAVLCGLLVITGLDRADAKVVPSVSIMNCKGPKISITVDVDFLASAQPPQSLIQVFDGYGRLKYSYTAVTEFYEIPGVPMKYEWHFFDAKNSLIVATQAAGHGFSARARGRFSQFRKVQPTGLSCELRP